jgi:hypothetical protein
MGALFHAKLALMPPRGAREKRALPLSPFMGRGQGEGASAFSRPADFTVPGGRPAAPPAIRACAQHMRRAGLASSHLREDNGTRRWLVAMSDHVQPSMCATLSPTLLPRGERGFWLVISAPAGLQPRIAAPHPPAKKCCATSHLSFI